MSNIQLSFLGTPRFYQNENPVKLSKTKGIALLVYLAAQRTPQTREQVTTLLWPDSLPQAARKNLRNILWDVRRTLGEEVVQVEADNLSLGRSVWADIHEFEDTRPSEDINEMEKAVALYRAPLAEGLNILEAPTFELWLTTERERLAQHYLRLLDGLITAHRTAANWPGVIASALQALAYDNLLEPMHQALMEAYARLGERSKALRQYDTLHTILSQELGVDPLPETEDLRRAIVNGHIQASKVPVATVIPPRQSGKPSQRPDLPFVGRQAEIDALDEASQRASTGHAQIVLLTGEVGIGKSRLWQAWPSRLSTSFTVLETRCLDATQSIPFAPLTRLFSQSVCTDQLFSPASPISPIWLAELSRLFPEIKEHRPDVPNPAELPPEEEHGRLFEAFTQVLRALNDQLLLLFIDDLHWIDRATLEWLVYLIDRMRNESLLLVGTYRISDAPPPLTRQVTNWNREGIVQHLPLKRLTLAESTELIAALNGDITLAEYLHTKSAGNPYFLIELNRAAPDDTPPALADLIRERLSHLSSTARQVVQAAAVLEVAFDFDILRRTSGRGEEETLNALDELLESAVLTEGENNYEFSHPLVASVVVDDLSAARRHFLHRRAAEALESAYASNPLPAAGRIASHYEQATELTLAARYAKMAGDYAMGLAAFAEAIPFYRQAYGLDPTPMRQLDLGWALFLMPEGHTEARETLQDALLQFEAQGDAAGIVRACLNLAFSYLPSGEGNRIINWVDRALPHLETLADPDAEARAHFLIGAGGFRVGRSMNEAEAHLIEARTLAVKHQLSETAMMSWFELGNLNLQRGNFSKAAEAFDQSLAIGQAENNIYYEVICYNNLAYTNLLANDLDQAYAYIEKGLTCAEKYSLMLPRQYLYSTRGEIALAEGKLDEAEQWFNQAVTVAENFGNSVHAANIRANLGLVAQARGNLDDALVLLTTARQAVADTINPHLQSQIDLWLAELYLDRGEYSAARESLSRAETHLSGRERRGLLAWARRVRKAIHQ